MRVVHSTIPRLFLLEPIRHYLEPSFEILSKSLELRTVSWNLQLIQSPKNLPPVVRGQFSVNAGADPVQPPPQPTYLLLLPSRNEGLVETLNMTASTTFTVHAEVSQHPKEVGCDPSALGAERAYRRFFGNQATSGPISLGCCPNNPCLLVSVQDVNLNKFFSCAQLGELSCRRHKPLCCFNKVQDITR